MKRPPDNEFRRDRCPWTGKVMFESQDAAKRSRRLARWLGGDPIVRVYRCGGCERWHTTSRGRR